MGLNTCSCYWFGLFKGKWIFLPGLNTRQTFTQEDMESGLSTYLYLRSLITKWWGVCSSWGHTTTQLRSGKKTSGPKYWEQCRGPLNPVDLGWHREVNRVVSSRDRLAQKQQRQADTQSSVESHSTALSRTGKEGGQDMDKKGYKQEMFLREINSLVISVQQECQRQPKKTLWKSSSPRLF